MSKPEQEVELEPDDPPPQLACLFQALQTACTASASLPLAACLMLDRWGYALRRASGVPFAALARKATLLQQQSSSSPSLAAEIGHEVLGSSRSQTPGKEREPYLYDIRRLPLSLPSRTAAKSPPTSRSPTHRHFYESRRFVDSRAFYARANEAAFESIVPYGVTTNTFIVDAYARILMAYLGDVQPHHRPGTKVYFLELAAGHCLFGYLLAKRLLAEKLAHWDICVVMTDFNQALLESRMKTPWMEPLVAAGLVDFATLDASSSKDTASSLELLASKTRIALGSIEGPVCVLGNYALDSFPVDIFLREEGGGLMEVVEDAATKQTILAPALEPEDAYPHHELLQALDMRGRESTLHVINVGFLNILRRIQAWLHPAHPGHLAFLLADGVFQHDDAAWPPTNSKTKKISLPDMSPGPGSGCFALASDPEALALTAAWVLGSGEEEKPGWLAVRNTVVESSLTVMLLAKGPSSLEGARKAFWQHACVQNPTDFEHLQGLILEEDGTEKGHLLPALGLSGMLALLRWSGYDSDLFLAIRWPLRDALRLRRGSEAETAVVQTTLQCLANRAVLTARAWQQTRYWGLQFLYALGQHREVLDFFLADAGHEEFAGGAWKPECNATFGSAAEAFLVARSLEKVETESTSSSCAIMAAVLADAATWRDGKGRRRAEKYLMKEKCT